MGDNMVKLKNNQLITIVGGVSISATLLNSLARGINVFLDLGRSLGSAIRRITNNKLCPF